MCETTKTPTTSATPFRSGFFAVMRTWQSRSLCSAREASASLRALVVVVLVVSHIAAAGLEVPPRQAHRADALRAARLSRTQHLLPCREMRTPTADEDVPEPPRQRRALSSIEPPDGRSGPDEALAS